MRLFGKITGSIDNRDRAAWLTPPFDKSICSTVTEFYVLGETRQFSISAETRTFSLASETRTFDV